VGPPRRKLRAGSGLCRFAGASRYPPRRIGRCWTSSSARRRACLVPPLARCPAHALLPHGGAFVAPSRKAQSAARPRHRRRRPGAARPGGPPRRRRARSGAARSSHGRRKVGSGCRWMGTAAGTEQGAERFACRGRWSGGCRPSPWGHTERRRLSSAPRGAPRESSPAGRAQASPP
jgi:hypothetical protein